MRRYTKAEREAAALICSLRACSWASGGPVYNISDVSASLGEPEGGPAETLARAARFGLPFSWEMRNFDQWAEAEALIRTGWSPP